MIVTTYNQHVRLLSSEPFGWFAPPKFTRAWEPTLLWNHYAQNPLCRSKREMACYRHLDAEMLACAVSCTQPNCALAYAVCVLLALSLSLSCQSKLNSAGAKVRSSPESIDAQNADLIARVKDASVSGLEKGLPTVRLEDWLRENSGPEWTISWSFTQGAKDPAAHVLGSGSVDVRGDTKDGRYFRLSIGTTTTTDQVLLFWLSGAVNVQNRWVGLEHLGQLPRLLHPVSQSSHTSERQK